MMDALSAFKFPGTSRPLHPLSPERVNNAGRMASSTTMTTTTSRATSARSELETDYDEPPTFKTPQSSPTRRSKHNLLLDLENASAKSSGGAGFASSNGLPQSPSLPDMNGLRGHARTNSDVQGLVKRFEHLDVRDRDAETAERRKKHEAELRRAQIAREEAESDAKRLREELRRYKKERDEGLDRERKVGKRLEVVMEEYAAFKEANSSQSGLYEKELRKARKEAFKSSSAVLKLQEELKSTRSTLRVAQTGLDMEKQKLQRKEQERFEMEYQLIPLQEQVEKLQEQLKIADEERETLKRSLKEEELARIASEGMIALPTSQGQDDDLLSPGKSPRKQAKSPLSDDKENQMPLKKNSEIRRMAEDLQRERLLRCHAEDLADFLRLECMFRCCSCKTASRLSRDFALRLDGELASRVDKIQAEMAETLNVAQDVPIDEAAVDEMEVEVERGVTESPIATREIIELKAESVLEQKVHEAEALPESKSNRSSVQHVTPDETSDDPSAQLMREEEAQHDSPAPNSPHQAPMEPETALSPSPPAPEVKVPLRPETPPQHAPGTPFRQQPSIRTVTTTTTIPMHFTPVARPTSHRSDLGGAQAIDDEEDDDEENIRPPASAPAKTVDNHHSETAGLDLAPTFDRAAALAAIEYRRGRARSFAAGHATPRKQMVEGVHGGRRDISAPVLGQKTTAGGGGDGAGAGQSSSVKRSGSASRHQRR